MGLRAAASIALTECSASGCKWPARRECLRSSDCGRTAAVAAGSGRSAGRRLHVVPFRVVEAGELLEERRRAGSSEVAAALALFAVPRRWHAWRAGTAARARRRADRASAHSVAAATLVAALVAFKMRSPARFPASSCWRAAGTAPEMIGTNYDALRRVSRDRRAAARRRCVSRRCKHSGRCLRSGIGAVLVLRDAATRLLARLLPVQTPAVVLFMHRRALLRNH